MKTNLTEEAATGGRDPIQCSDTTHPFLASMEPERVRRLLDHAQIAEFQPKEIILRAGEPADRFFLIQSGSVALEARAKGHGLMRIDTVKAGEVFGWSWLFPPFAWHFQARALEPTRALVCDGARLLVMCEEDATFGYALMKRITQVVIHRLMASTASRSTRTRH